MKRQIRQISKIAARFLVYIIFVGLLFPVHAVAQTKKATPKPKTIYWYTDFTITVKGSGIREGDASGRPEIRWHIDRLYSGRAALNRVGPALEDEMKVSLKIMQNPEQIRKIMAEAERSRSKLEFTIEEKKDVLMRVKIDDTLEVITQIEECADNSDESKIEAKLWKVDGAFPGAIGGIRLVTDNKLLTYNITIPIYFVGPIASMFSRTKYERSNNVTPSKKDTEFVGTKVFIPNLPLVQSLIENQRFVEHKTDRPFPANFTTAWEFDSGNLMPDEPLIDGVPDSKTKVQVRVRYRFSKTPLY